MHKLALALLLALSIESPRAFADDLADILVVTHPQVRFDQDRRAGKGTSALLRSDKFQAKYVLVTEPEAELTFDDRNNEFEKVLSLGGEFERNLGPAKYTVAGGFLTACLSATIEDLAVHSQATNFRVVMDATYSYMSMVHFPNEKYGDFPRTLKGLEDQVGADGEALVETISEAGNYLHRSMTSAFRRKYGPNSGNGVQLELRIHGKFLMKLDPDPRENSRVHRVVIDFD